MGAMLEHVNLQVQDINKTSRFLTTAFPDFRERGGGIFDDGRHWLHVGTDDQYLALFETHSDDIGSRLGHIGFTVDDVDALSEHLVNAGFKETSFSPTGNEWHRRRYFWDDQGLMFEFVQYFSDDPNKRNHYD